MAGVGERSAAALVSRFSSLEALLAALDGGGQDGFPAGTRTKLAAARGYLEAAPAVARVRTDAPLPDHDDAIPDRPAGPERLVALGERWSLDGPLNRVLRAMQIATDG